MCAAAASIAATIPTGATPTGALATIAGLRVAPTRFYRPYYSFRPRLSLGFGLWVGYPVPYYDPYYYPDYSYGYPYPAAGYPAYPPAASYPQSAYPPAAYPQTTYPQSAAPGSINVQPSQTNTGGLSFDITPGEAEFIVDGNAGRHGRSIHAHVAAARLVGGASSG